MFRSAHIIELMATASQLPYAWIERATRPLKEAGFYMHRGNSEVRLEHLAGISLALAASQPSEALATIEMAQAVCFIAGTDKPMPGAGPDNCCYPEDASFDRGGNNHPTLWGYVLTIIRQLAEMDAGSRHQRIDRLKKAGWRITVCSLPKVIMITWCEAKDNSYIERTENWIYPQNNPLRSWSRQQRGVQRFTSIPPEVFHVAADVYAGILSKKLFASDKAPASAIPEDEGASSPAREPAPNRACDVPVDQTDLQSADQFCSRDDSLNNATAAERMRESKNAQALSGCITGRPLQLFGANRYDRTQECTKSDFRRSTSAGAQGSRGSGC